MSIFGLMTRKEFDRRMKVAMDNLPGWLSATAAASEYTGPDLSIYGNQADLYRKLSWVLTSVDLVAQGAALQNFNVSNVKGEKKEIENHPFELRMQKPNPLDSRYEVLYGTIAMWKLTGNGYWWLNRANEKAEVDEIWVIPSHQIAPLPDKKMFVRGYSYDPGDGSSIFLEPWEILHFRRFNPFSRFYGMSAIESLSLVAQGDIGMQDWNTRLFKENNARLPGIITFEQYVEDQQWAKIKLDVRESAKKRDLMMLRGVGAGEVKWMQNSVSQKDMEFLAGRKANKEEIYSVLAPGAASVLDVNATEANAKTGRATLMEYGVYPMLVMMQEKITAQILPVYGDNLKGEFDDPRMSDRVLELKEIAEYSKTHTVEEIRQEYYGDQPLGDERDKQFPAQVTTTKAEEPVTEEDTELPEDSEDKSEISPESIKALVEMDKWEAKCNRAGKMVTWHNVNIPEDVFGTVKAMDDFAGAREAIKGKGVPELVQQELVQQPDPAMMALAEALREAAKAVSITPVQPQPTSFTISLPSDMVKMEQLPTVVNVPAPVVNVSVSPTPVTIDNTVEPASVTVTPIPAAEVTVENKIEVKPADVVLPKPRKMRAKKQTDGSWEMEAK